MYVFKYSEEKNTNTLWQQYILAIKNLQKDENNLHKALNINWYVLCVQICVIWNIGPSIQGLCKGIFSLDIPFQ